MQKSILSPIYDEHQGKLVSFAGYQMPVQYKLGVKAEHLWCREHAAFFDISHMGQAWLCAESGGGQVQEALEQLVAADLQALPPGGQQYTQLLNDQGGILDDLIVTKPAEPQYQDRLYIVVNGACKAKDFAYISKALAGQLRLEPLPNHALMALQGPQAIAVAQRHFAGIEQLRFMNGKVFSWNGNELYISRSGYTGEDGIEISASADCAVALARLLLAEQEVEPAGLGARDSLRLEAGLCLYGHDLCSQISPVEAGLQWSIAKSRRQAGSARANFAGAKRILQELAEGPAQKRIGLDIQDRMPCRPGTPIYASQEYQQGAEKIGEVCSGGYSPSLEKPIAMAYVAKPHHKLGTEVWLEVRHQRILARVCRMPFIPAKYAK